jgi:hypothetical protein
VEDALFNSLKSARETLFLALKLSKQSAYHRRAPEPDSLPHFGETRRLLEDVLKEHPDNLDALVMMSQLLESLLDFEGAATFLCRAFAAGVPKTNKSLKRLALLRENATAWRDLSLSPEALRELGHYLRNQGVGPGHRTMQLTREWLVKSGIPDPDNVISGLERWGAFSDFQVLTNVVLG